MRPRHPIGLLIGLPAGVIVADQISKFLILDRMQLFESIPVLPGLFSITSIRNPGAAFGLLGGVDDNIRILLLSAVSILAVALLAIYYLRSAPHERLSRFAAALVIGGALGNLIDRVRFGEVIDFLDVYIGRYHWPAFNIADSAISIGIGLFLWGSWQEHRAGQGSDNAPDKGPGSGSNNLPPTVRNGESGES